MSHIIKGTAVGRVKRMKPVMRLPGEIVGIRYLEVVCTPNGGRETHNRRSHQSSKGERRRDEGRGRLSRDSR